MQRNRGSWRFEGSDTLGLGGADAGRKGGIIGR